MGSDRKERIANLELSFQKNRDRIKSSFNFVLDQIETHRFSFLSDWKRVYVELEGIKSYLLDQEERSFNYVKGLSDLYKELEERENPLEGLEEISNAIDRFKEKIETHGRHVASPGEVISVV